VNRDEIHRQGGPSADAEEMSVLKERAKKLAALPDTAGEIIEEIEILEFALGEERFGIEATFIDEVYPLKEITPVPCTPPFVSGIVNIRGQIVSVLDLKKRFEMPEGPITDNSVAIVIGSDSMKFGILGDAVLGTRQLPRAEVKPPPPTLTGVRLEYLVGVTGERLAVLDAKRILGDRGLVVNEEVER